MNPVDRSKYRGELWTKKFKGIRDPWQTCNREYGDFTPRHDVVKMETVIAEDEGPRIASTYQMGYNVKPEFRHKWMDSWKGYVKKKKPAHTAPYRSIKNVQKGVTPRSNPGVRLPPLPGQKSSSQDIEYRNGSIYMPTTKAKPARASVNERFFGFSYKDIWMPLSFR